MTAASDIHLIRSMLDAGQLARSDELGHQYELRARCPADDTSAPVYRVARSGQKLVEVVCRCPSCGQDFVAAPERMHLA